MEPIKIKEGIYWIGALDPGLRLFDVLFPTEGGTTYNSYLVMGEKVAVVDTAKGRCYDEFLANLTSLVAPRDVDYIVCNHMEPDHSGSLAAFLRQATNAQVIVSRTGEHFLRNLLNTDVGPLKVGDGDALDPDTMFTYAVEDKVLFPCDVLGSHFCDERMFDDLVGDFSAQFEYYYRGIMGPFKDKMLEALDKIQDLEIGVVAPSHGPILRGDPWKYVKLYREWSTLPTVTSMNALIFYASAHGNTKLMTEEVAKGVASRGVGVELFDLTETLPGDVLNRIEAAQALIIGSPTINGDAVKPVWDLLSSLATIRLRGKVGGAFGSYGWSGEAVGMIEDRLKSLKFKVPEPGQRFVLVPTTEDLEACREFGARIAERL
jgi:flavorubredoxin